MAKGGKNKARHGAPFAPASSQGGSRRMAAIDVGTNSIRLIVAEASPDGSYRILDDEKETTRLGQGLESSGMLSPMAMEQSALALARMKRIAEGFGVEVIKAIGTCAVREATNREEFLSETRARAHLVVEPISSNEEAQLAHLSVAHAFDLRSMAVAVVDLGGGSTEVVLSSGGVVEKVYSLPLGAVRLTEQFGGAERCAGPGFEKMCRAINRMFRSEIKKPPFIPQMIIGTGGTFTTLANIASHRHASADEARPGRGSVRGYEMKRSEVRHLVDNLRELSPRARSRVAGLSPDRSDIIVAGAAIVEGIMKHLSVNRLQVHDGGVRDGLLLTLVRQLFPRKRRDAVEPPDRLRSIRQFAATCGYEEQHCQHVAKLAGQIFDQLAGYFPARPGKWSAQTNRLLLEGAALARDVGYLINYSKHHQHSYHLIVHGDLPGFTPREIQLLAMVARYHRRAEPKKKHPEFRALAKADRKLVRRLAAILRIADGLDRNRLQNVRKVTIRVKDEAAVFILDSPEAPAVDIWGAIRKGKLFHKVFGVRPLFEWKSVARKIDNEIPDIHET